MLGGEAHPATGANDPDALLQQLVHMALDLCQLLRVAADLVREAPSGLPVAAQADGDLGAADLDVGHSFDLSLLGIRRVCSLS